MAVCPYLLLEEQGTRPFPFPSVSHRCFVTGTGVPIDQREQRTYCLVKHYTLCPFFRAQPAQATVLDTIPELVAPAIAATPAIELATIPESVGPASAAISSEEPSCPRPAAADAVAESASSPGRDALPQEATVQPATESVAARELELPLSEEELSSTPMDAQPDAEARERPAAKDAGPAPEGLRLAPQLPRRALIWAAMAGMCIVVLCIAALTIYRVAHLSATGVLSLGSSELVPWVLLFLSLSSFAVVFLLAALLLRARRPAA